MFQLQGFCCHSFSLSPVFFPFMHVFFFLPHTTSSALFTPFLHIYYHKLFPIIFRRHYYKPPFPLTSPFSLLPLTSCRLLILLHYEKKCYNHSLYTTPPNTYPLPTADDFFFPRALSFSNLMMVVLVPFPSSDTNQEFKLTRSKSLRYTLPHQSGFSSHFSLLLTVV